MKKEVIFILIIVMLINLISASSQINNNTLNIDIKKGWNLIPTYSWKLENINSNIKMSNFSYGFIFDNLKNKYILVYNNGWVNDKNEDILIIDGLEDYYIRSSMWIYSEIDGEYLLNWGENDSYLNFKINNYNLKKGWNFIFISPAMVDKNILSFSDECKFNKIFSYQNDLGYTNMLIDKRLVEERISNVDLGKGLLIKVEEDCNFKINETNIYEIDKEDVNFESGSYTLLTDINKINSIYTCENSKDYPTKGIKYSGEVCYYSYRLEFVDSSSDKGLFVILYNYEKSKDLHQKYLSSSSRKEFFEKNTVYRLEDHELLFFPSLKYDTIITQEFQRKINDDGTVSYTYTKANGDNPIFRYYLEKYFRQNNNLSNEAIADSCMISVPFGCDSFRVNNLSEVLITIKNQENISIKINSVSLSNCEINTNQGNGWNLDKTNLQILVRCNNLVRGSRFKEDIIVKYSKSGEMIERTSTGTLSMKVN
ncbi:MAG: hypothetical protein WC867_00110 [Candidatus Pacearchaeota archaeon]|jgi:hypothetical protein